MLGAIGARRGVNTRLQAILIKSLMEVISCKKGNNSLGMAN